MQDLPDAPWIREAERFGVPSEPDPICPICNEEAEEFFVDQYGEILGCEHCVRKVDAYTYRINE